MSITGRCASALVLCGSILLGTGPLSAGTYYVSLTGNDENNGTTPERAWRTLAYAATKAVAGDTVFIKAGDYGREIVKVANSGTEKAPIIFQGYKDKPGDTPDPKYQPGDDLDPNAMPVFDGKAEPGRGIEINKKNYITICNLGLTWYDGAGIYAEKSKHIVMENIYTTNIATKTTAHSYCMGFYLVKCEYCTIRNCVATDCSGDNIHLGETHNSVVERCKTYGVKIDPPALTTDYYIYIGLGHDNVVRDCLAENLHWQVPTPRAHPGHGIGIKDAANRSGPGYIADHSYNNRIINCVVRNCGESIYVSHEAHHNEFIDCTVYQQWRKSPNRWNYGYIVRDGAHDNVFRNCRADGVRFAVNFSDSVEGPKAPKGSPAIQICTKNTFVNCVFTDLMVGLEFGNATDNLLKNCVIANVDRNLLQFRSEDGKTVKRNLLRNSIVTNVRGAYEYIEKGCESDVQFSYSDFWENKFDAPAGKGNVTKDPLFADAAKKDFHLKSKEGRWDNATSAWVKDSASSPCIDAGDPSDDYAAEPQPNGGRINMGAYGNTAEASK